MNTRTAATKELLKELISKMQSLMAKGDGDKEMDSTGAESTAKEMAEEAVEEMAPEAVEAPAMTTDDEEMERFREFMRGGKKTIPKATGVTMTIVGMDKKRMPPAMRTGKSKASSFGKMKAKA
jgi:hypothetical protein